MMAAAAAAVPRLRALLRAQTLRGPLWARNPPVLVMGPAGRSLSGQTTLTPPSSAAAAASSPLQSLPPSSPPPPSPSPVDPLPVPPDPFAEPRLDELGLGGFTPVGLIQDFLQFLHLDLGLPWWGAIAVGTLSARLALLPLLLWAQREAARLGLHLPRLQELSQRLAEARRGDNPLLVARAYSELVAYQQRHNVNPLRGFLVPLVQTPLFISFFLALRGMAAAPVPGLQRGGLAWFPDLCSPDPLYLLPLAVTASTWMVLELGAETGVASPAAGTVRQLLRLLPLLFLPFIIHFPTAIFTYWLTSNSFSLLHTGLLRIPALRRRLGIVAAPPPAPSPAPGGQKKGLLARLKQEWAEAQAQQRGEQRRLRLRQQLQEAARGPLRQTFPHNPLSPHPGGGTPAPAPPPVPKRPWKETLG